MEKFKGTPGPWSWSNLSEDENSLRGEGGKIVFWGDNISSGFQTDDGWAARIGATNSDDESECNAKLIAAAPDLLEALQYARRFMNKQDHDIEYVDAAIARALGKNDGEE